jgi:protocatechuate 3,4-dioxygenase beta subunit
MTLRRRTLLSAGAGLLLPAAPALAQIPPTRPALTPTPAQTEGPYYPARLPADIDNDLVQLRGAEARALGTVTHVSGRVLDSAGRPLTAVEIDLWQCDSHGVYDHPRDPGAARRDAAFQGFGRTATDADGRYAFRTIKPVAYAGRTPHLHFRVSPPGGRRLTTQMYVAGDPGNDRDMVLSWIADRRQREAVMVRLEPAPGVEDGALAGTFDIVLSYG